MRIVSPQCSLALGAAILAISGGNALAQYNPQYSPQYNSRYDRYERDDRYGYDRYDRYQRYRRYDPYADDFHARRRTRNYTRDEFPPRAIPQHKKAKHREIEPQKKAVAEQPAKGPYQIVVSLASQRIYLYGADGLIRESRVSTGMRGHSTPPGIFSVIEKDYYHRSNIYSGAPMPLMQRITWSGIALHEGVLPGYPASHGCIRMNGEFAKFLWHTTQKGARVIVARSEIDPPAPIASPRLFAPVSKPRESISAATSLAKEVSNGNAAITQTASAVNDAATTPAAETAPDAGTSGVPLYKAPIMPARKGQVAVFISRKTGKLYVRYAETPLFETPVTIRDRDQPIGTHIFTAMEPIDDGKDMKWSVSSIPTPAETQHERKRTVRDKIADIAEKPAIPNGRLTAQAALDRTEIPKDAAERIGELLTPGSSLTISDYAMSEETGDGTEFIVLMR